MKLGRIRTQAAQSSRRHLHKRMPWRTAWQILEQFAGGRMSETKACEWLRIGRSRLYQLRRRWLDIWSHQKPKESWLYQRPDTLPSRLSLDVQSFLEDQLRYWRQESPFFRGHINFAFLAQQCHQRFGHRFHRNTLRRWATARGLFDPQTDSTGKAYVRFETGGVGMLFQHDSSLHAWLPLTQRNDVLVLTIDDHSRKVVGARLVPQDTTWHHLCVIRDTIETYGAPLAYYTDNHRIFTTGTEIHTQLSRALASLEISLRLTAKAYPQAKGKVEKRFDYFQRRIPLLCEQYQITSLAKANRILQDQVAYYNGHHIHAETHEIPDKRWQRALQENRGHLQRVNLSDHRLDQIFALHYPRVVRSDGTVAFAGRLWPIPHAPIGQELTVVLRPPSLPRSPHTQIFLVYQGKTIAHHILMRPGRPTLS